MKLIKMLPAMGFVIAAALVALTSAFKEAPKKTSSGATIYYYTYSSLSQNPDDRKDGHNYTNPQLSLSGCGGFTDECGVEVSVSGTTPPPDISGLNVTYNSTSGMPEIGGDVKDNFLKN